MMEKLKRLVKVIIGHDESEKEAQQIKNRVIHQTVVTTQKIDSMNMVIRKSTTYHIARAMGVVK